MSGAQAWECWAGGRTPGRQSQGLGLASLCGSLSWAQARARWGVSDQTHPLPAAVPGLLMVQTQLWLAPH